MNIPNLDNLPTADLYEFKATVEALAKYADLTLAAREHRMLGEIKEARYCEAEADEVYGKLPTEARW